VPSSHASSLDYSCLKSNDGDVGDLLDLLSLSSPLSRPSTSSGRCDTIDRSRSEHGTGAASSRPGTSSKAERGEDLGFPVGTPSLRDSANAGRSLSGRTSRGGDLEEASPSHTSLRTSLRSRGRESESEPLQDHAAVSTNVSTAPPALSRQPSGETLSTLKCMAVGGLNEWLVMNMRSQGTPYSGTDLDTADTPDVEPMLDNDSSGSEWSEMFNRCAEGFLRQMAQAESLERDIQQYIEQQQRDRQQTISHAVVISEGDLEPQISLASPDVGRRDRGAFSRQLSDSSVGSDECRTVAVCVASDIIHKGAAAHITKQRLTYVAQPKLDRMMDDTKVSGEVKGHSRRRGGRVQDTVSRSVLTLRGDDNNEHKSDSKGDRDATMRQSWGGYDSKRVDEKCGSKQHSAVYDAKSDRRQQRLAAADAAKSEYTSNGERFAAMDEEIVGEVILLRQAISESNMMTMRSAMQLGHIAAQIVVENIPYS
jgi:hypothetical protein